MDAIKLYEDGQDVVIKMEDGKVTVKIQFDAPEGSTMESIVQKAASSGVCSSTLSAFKKLISS